ncbi:c-type cytochrome [Candidatus Ferrigenium straubiae]|uniref:c-type cytochrome n=1 Tax=Candidatus Ferrigenium straubiae TaxID=2919506 RepID=UPI003F4AE2D1
MKSILLVSLFVPLYGCQPEAPAPKAAAPAVEQPPAPPAPAMEQPAAAPPVQPAATAPAQAMQPAPAEKAMQSAPAPASPAPAAKAEPAPVAAEAKPAPAVSEADFMQLAKKSNCLACHSVDKKIVGPAFKDVAAKYRGDTGAEARLVDKIAKGGSGVWGAMMMPPSPQISEADRRTLAKYILSLK